MSLNNNSTSFNKSFSLFIVEGLNNFIAELLISKPKSYMVFSAGTICSKIFLDNFFASFTLITINIPIMIITPTMLKKV
ncbi:MAG: hypothetical protein ACD_79C01186G0003 [uncultured bacterium]|nr:MAG: hypothetical protein ACD_79C01186G0003 [uncultured bacterium]